MQPPVTQGAAKWAAVAVLGVAAVAGVARSFFLEPPRPAQVVDTVRSEPTTDAVPPAVEHPQAAAPTDPSPAPQSRKVNLNTAPAAELELLPGIGPALAARIIEYRTEHGPFKTVSEIDKVKGIGPRLLERIRPLAIVE